MGSSRRRPADGELSAQHDGHAAVAVGRASERDGRGSRARGSQVTGSSGLRSRRFISIRYKLLLAFATLTLVPLAFGGLYVFLVVPGLLEDRAKESMREEVAADREIFGRYLAGVEGDVAVLSQQPALQRLLSTLPAPATDHKDELAQQFLLFAQEKENYQQVRYIDKTGQEVVRVDRRDGLLRVVPDSDLQDKSERYYFTETVRLSAGEVYVSELDLNREFGAVERPFRPVLRFATQVLDSEGDLRGIVIVNVEMNPLLASLENDPSGPRSSILIDGDGHYLMHPDAAKKWGGPTDLNTGESYFRDYPAAKSVLAVKDQAAAIGEFGTEDTLDAFSFVGPSGDAGRWILITSADRGEVFSPANTYRLTFLGVLGGVIAALVGLSWATVRRLTAPLAELREGAGEIAEGHLDHRLKVRTRDEIEEVAQAFNAMASRLEESYATLEARVEERTSQLKDRQEKLQALNEAGLTMVAERSPETVLQTVVDCARRLVGARYGALAVVRAEGRIEKFVTSGIERSAQERIGPLPTGKGILGQLLTEGKPLRLADLTQHPLFTGFPEHHPNMKSFVAVPIAIRGKVIGNLYLTEKEDGDEFSLEDERALVTLAAQAAVAIDNARLYAREHAAVERLRELDQLKTDFVSTVSHELRSPIASLHAYAKILADHRADLDLRKQEEILDQMEAQADHLVELVEDVLHVSRIDSGRLEVLLQPTDLAALIDEVANEVRASLSDHDVVVSPAGGLSVVRADPGLLRQAVGNLVDNAAKYSPAATTVEIAWQEVPARGEVWVTVADEGIGIAPEDTSKIFEKFSRIRSEHTDRISGTGLGLYIAKSIVEAHGGRIWVESERGRGSKFICALLAQGEHD